MRPIVIIIGLAISLPCAAQSPLPHHQPSQAEIKQRENASPPSERSVYDQSTSLQIDERFLAACIARVYLDEPLGSEQKHGQFCNCQLGLLKASITGHELQAVAINIEERDSPAARYRLPANVDQIHQAAVLKCMDKLSP